ncbi:hypothetical protein J132_09133 [Termitomyces sp. J132]|nr:hypothetical protein J132_09133 [Termitomyces sp. J132]
MADLTDLDYVLCDTELSISNAAAVLSSSSLLALDCEGRGLGETGFLIDTVRLKGERLRPIYDILESTSIPKVVYDGRKDFSCLFHDRRVEIRNVIDLQLVDIKSREIRGENDADRLLRLGQVVPKWELARNSHLYRNVHKLCGMNRSAEEHLGLKVEKNAPKFDHSLWLERPLATEQLLYAVKDVVMISDLYNAFDAAGYLYPQIHDDSSRYVSIWKDRRPTADDIYRELALRAGEIFLGHVIQNQPGAVVLQGNAWSAVRQKISMDGDSVGKL